MAEGIVSVRLMGGFAVEIDGVAVPDDAWRSRRAADLVKMLALAPRHRLTREQVMDALWPDLDPDSGAANVRKAAHRARRTMGPEDAITLTGGLVTLAPGRVIETDVERFDDACSVAIREDTVAGYREAASLYGGELLPDNRYEPWCERDGDRLRLRYLDMLAGGELWGRLVDEEPANEKAHQEIMKAHLASGDRRAAIRQFAQLRSSLHDQLGVSPDPTSVELYEKVLAMEGPDTPTPAERARALLAWGVVHWERADLEETKKTAAAARALAIDAGLGRELSEASELLGLVAYAQGEWQDIFGWEFVETIRETPDLAPFVLDAHMCMSEFALWEKEGITAMSDFADEIIRATENLDSPQGRAFGLLVRAEAGLLGDGDRTRIRHELEEASRLHDQAGCVTGRVLAEERMAQLLMEEAENDEGLRRHHRALELAAAAPSYRHLLLFIYGGMLDGLGSDDLAKAVELIEAAEEAKVGVDICDPCAMGYWVGAATATARAGDIEAARRHLAEAERVVQMWPSGPWHAAVTEARAAVRLGEGDASDAVVELLEKAAAGFEAADRPREMNRCRQRITALR